MRVIVGRLRGRKLRGPSGAATRPILDRVKQALFDRLGARFGLPGEIPPIDVLDLFAGAGGLGIEALSRGARSATLVECDRAALACLRANVADLELESAARIVAARAETAAVRPPGADPFGLVFLDPPYPMSAALTDDSPLGRVLHRLAVELPVSRNAPLVWRFDRALVPDQLLPGGWTIAERHDYGSMSLAFLARGAAA
ncbi:MAG: RsmD family RNA methyltransferase [Phycisphaerae bacterium]